LPKKTPPDPVEMALYYVPIHAGATAGSPRSGTQGTTLIVPDEKLKTTGIVAVAINAWNTQPKIEGAAVWSSRSTK